MRILGRDKKGRKVWITVPDWETPHMYNVSSVTGAPTTYLGITTAPYAWYDSRTNVYSDLGTTSATNNSNVKQWNDLSGNNRHLFNNSGAFFTYKTNQQNTYPAISGTSTFLQTSASFGGFSGSHIFLTLTVDANSGYGEFLGGPSYIAGTDWYTIVGSGAGDIYAGTEAATAKRANTGSFYSNTVPFIIQARLSGGLASVRKNNSPTWIDAASGGSQNTPNTVLQIGNAGNATAFRYYSLVVYNTYLSDADAAIVEANLNAIWAVH